MGFRTTKLGERVSVDTRKMSNGESELFEFDEDTKPYFVDYTLTDFIVKMINEKRITTAQIADLSNLEPNYIRDYIIMTCIRANKSIWECNDYLIENGVDGVVTEE